METYKAILTGVCIPALTIGSYANSDDALQAHVSAAWTTPGTEWLVRVKQDARAWGLMSTNPKVNEEAQKPRVAFESHVRITVLEPRVEGDQRIARIQFTALDDAPSYAQGTVLLEIDPSTGAPRSVKKISGKVGGNLSIGEFDGERAFFSDSVGFPISWIVDVADLAQIPQRKEEHRVAVEARSSLGPTGHFHQFVKRFRPTVTDTDKKRAVEIEAFSLAPLAEVPYYRVLQTWVPGEGWWRSYTRYIQGHLDLEATLVQPDGE